MIKKLISLAAMAFIAASCTNVIDNVESLRLRAGADDDVVFYATLEGRSDAETKVFADEQMRVLWNAGDLITIFNLNTYNQPYQFKGEDGDNAGGFEKVPSGDEFATGGPIGHIYSVYPYQEATKITYDGVLSVSLPALQHYKAHSFGIGANTMVSVSDDNLLMFKNVGGYLSFKFYGNGVSIKSISLKGNNNEKLAGNATVTMPFGGTPAVEMQESATEKVTLTCETPVELGATENDYTEFWFVLPPTNFTQGFTVTVTDALGGVFTKTTSSEVDVQRSNLSRMSVMEVLPDYENPIIPFDDANFKAYCVEHFDKDHDGEISLKEAREVKDIDVCTDNISSLGGISFFTELESLYCGGSEYTLDDGSSGQLSALDVSCNSKLRVLNCEINQLSELDLSQNPLLEELNCKANKFATLALAGNSELRSINLELNMLKELDMSGCPNLKEVRIPSNKLEKIDLSCLPKLYDLDLRYNNLESINFSSNPNLDNIAVDGNPLTRIDVSQNENLTSISCNGIGWTIVRMGAKNRYGSWISHYDKKGLITKLDVSHNPKLFRIQCSNNQLVALDLSQNAKLTTLSCEMNAFSSLDVSNNPILSSLQCQSNPNLTEIWLISTQTISNFSYDTDIAVLKYRDLLPEEEYATVDLGLPSGTLWSNKNVGAKRTSETGGRYAWGELETKDQYNDNNYKWYQNNEVTKYSSDGKTYLEEEDDVATQVLGDGWRMPGAYELNELMTLCTWTLEMLDGIQVYKVTGPNGNFIHFPLNGQMDESNTLNHNYSVMLWSSENMGSWKAVRLIYDQNEQSVDCVNDRADGLCVRPVKGSKTYSYARVIADQAGSLPSLMTSYNPMRILALKVVGHMDARDFNYIKWECRNIQDIDLSEVTIDAYTGDEGTNEGYEATYAADEIPMGAFFYWCSNDKREFPEELFDEGMASLKRVVLPPSVKAIRRNAFARAYNLTEINFPEGLKTIDYVSFRYCTSLAYISLPSSLNEIGVWAFTGMNSLRYVYCSAQVPPTVNQSFGGVDDLNGARGNVDPSSYNAEIVATLLVPTGTAEAYRNSEWGTYFKTIIER